MVICRSCKSEGGNQEGLGVGEKYVWNCWKKGCRVGLREGVGLGSRGGGIGSGELGGGSRHTLYNWIQFILCFKSFFKRLARERVKRRCCSSGWRRALSWNADWISTLISLICLSLDSCRVAPK